MITPFWPSGITWMATAMPLETVADQYPSGGLDIHQGWPELSGVQLSCGRQTTRQHTRDPGQSPGPLPLPLLQANEARRCPLRSPLV